MADIWRYDTGGKTSEDRLKINANAVVNSKV